VRITSNVIHFIASLLFKRFRRFEREISEIQQLYENYLTRRAIPTEPILIRAVILAEDHRHSQHKGVDIVALIRAAWSSVFKSSLQGGSTIEQQLVRTIIGRYEKTLSRKGREILLASIVGMVIPKSEISSVYLSIAYFGTRMNGIEEALAHFDLLGTKLSSRDAASIISRLKYPEPERISVKRQNQIHVRTEHILSLLTSDTLLLASPSLANVSTTTRLLAASTAP